MEFKYIILLIFVAGLATSTVGGLEIKDIEYYENSQNLVITLNNPNSDINANISIIGYMDNKIDTKVEIFNYTIPKNSLLFVRKRMVFNEKGEHTVYVIIKSNNATYSFFKKIDISYAYDNRIPIYEEEVKKNINIEGLYFDKNSVYPFPFYDFIYVIVKNNDVIPHYVNVSLTASLDGEYYATEDGKIIKSNPPNTLVVKSWNPSIYISPKSTKIIPMKVNFNYAGNYKITVNAVDDEGHRDEETYDKILVECPLYIYNITCECEYGNYTYSNWFDIEINNTVDYDVYGTLNVFLCEKKDDNYIILDNKTINKYFLAKGFNGGYSIPVKLNTSALNPYDEDFVVFVAYNTGTIRNVYKKSFKKPVKINGLEVKDYPENYHFIDETIFYDSYVNITNNLDEYIKVNVSIVDIYNKTYSKEVKLAPKKYKNYTIVKFDGLKINAKDLSHDGKIKLRFTITAITPPYEKYYITKKNEIVEVSLIPTPPVYVQNTLNDEVFVGYYQNLSFTLKKVVGRTVYARVYVTVPDEINDSAFFEEKYLKIGTMEEIPVNIKALFLKEYNGPIYIHVDTDMGVRECVATRIVEAKPIISCEDLYLNNYTVLIKIRNRTEGLTMNEPIVGYPVNVTLSLKSYVPNLKDIEIWASAMDENRRLINCSEKKRINIYGNHRKINLEILLNDSLEGYLIIYAKTGEAIIPLYYRPIMVTYPITFELNYNPSNAWANLTLSHNYQVPLKVVATVDKYSKEITIYPYKDVVVPFYVGKDRKNVSVTIELSNSVSPIKKFEKTFYFGKLEKNKDYMEKDDKINKSKEKSTHNVSLPPDIGTCVGEGTRTSKNESELSHKVTGIISLKDLIYILVILICSIFIGLVVISLIYKPTHLKITPIFNKLKLKKKYEKEKHVKALEPPKVYMFDIIYSFGDVVKMEIFSEGDVDDTLYVLSPTNKKYKIELEKVGKNKYIGSFKIPENEAPGQYFIVYKPENLAISGFLVVDIKK
ncbi:hypothetical protein [Methanocaldococcus fervens]|uniref:Uncharacterized protein n=1 Tax=Methanocaldococcus fervens (strain DSM 4213 / JCM 15782 / AG86) TaxID=573064 RepID=C7P5V5_METFA|nr:hypothetical protein [Methanocaldococcus fervens]ACV23937.1 hypothetical protein Mefer_0095 [Methanocaldococcus fervens AG86]